MPDVIATTEHGLEEGERRAERDLGAIVNEVEHLGAQLVEHTTTLKGLEEDKTWIRERLEALERDLAAIPHLPEELIRSTTEAIAALTSRIERLEAAATSDEDEETKPPRRHEENTEKDERRDGERRAERRSLLDRLF